MLVSRVPKERASKIDMNQLRDFFATDDYFKILEGEQIAMEMDGLKKYQSILSKELPPEQCNGIMNLAYILHNPKATTEEIESTLVICNEKFAIHADLKHLFECNQRTCNFFCFRTICMEMILLWLKHHSLIRTISGI